MTVGGYGLGETGRAIASNTGKPGLFSLLDKREERNAGLRTKVLPSSVLPIAICSGSSYFRRAIEP